MVALRRDLGEDRRLEVEAPIQAGRPPTAGRQLGTVVEGPVHVCLNAFQLCSADQRAHLHVGIGGIADLHGPGQRDQPIDDLVVDRVGKQHPAVQDAGLPGVERTRLEQHALQQLVVQRYVVEHDAGRLASALEQQPFHGPAGRGHHFAADH